MRCYTQEEPAGGSFCRRVDPTREDLRAGQTRSNLDHVRRLKVDDLVSELVFAAAESWNECILALAASAPHFRRRVRYLESVWENVYIYRYCLKLVLDSEWAFCGKCIFRARSHYCRVLNFCSLKNLTRHHFAFLLPPLVLLPTRASSL